MDILNQLKNNGILANEIVKADREVRHSSSTQLSP